MALHNKAQVQVLNVFLYVLGSEQCVQKHFNVYLRSAEKKKTSSKVKMFASSLNKGVSLFLICGTEIFIAEEQHTHFNSRYQLFWPVFVTSCSDVLHMRAGGGAVDSACQSDWHDVLLPGDFFKGSSLVLPWKCHYLKIMHSLDIHQINIKTWTCYLQTFMR